jgi:hypothetical protein
MHSAYCTGLLLARRVLNLLEMDNEYEGNVEVYWNMHNVISPCPSTFNDVPFAGFLCKFILIVTMCIVRQLGRITQLNLQRAGDHSVPSLMLVF